MSYEFDERTDKPKRYCSVSKLSQQEMPKTDEPRCRYCCERLVAVVNWTEEYRRLCCTCRRIDKMALYRAGGGERVLAAKPTNRGWTRCAAVKIRARAKQKGKSAAAINVLEDEIKRFLELGCAICGCALRMRNAGEQGAQEGCLQVDCIDPQQGYIVGNMQGLCPRCNRLKQDHTLETAELLYKHLLAHEYKRKYGFELHHLPVKPIPVEPPEVPTRG